MDPLLNALLEILKFTIPSVVVFLVCYKLISKLLEENIAKQKLEIIKENQKLITPLKLQAYERFVLLLERISPQHLIMSYNNSEISATALKTTMISAINQEFGHNLSQQLYISSQAWGVIKVIKEEVVQFVITNYDKLPERSTGIDLSKAMIEQMMQNNYQPTVKGIEFLKKEISIYF